MRALITGSTGLLGNNLVRTLLAAGHDVLALARSREKAAPTLGDTRARIVIGDMVDVSAFAAALEGVDVVFHTAAYFREYYAPGDHAAIISRLNVEATMELARAAHDKGVRKMIHTSSAGIIGLKPDGSPGDEHTPPWSGVARNLYLQSKLSVEPRLRAFSRASGLSIAAVLPGWMWGPHDSGPTAAGQLAFDALAGNLPPAIPPGGSSVADARDVALGMLRVAEVGRADERYILSGPFVDLGAITARLAAITGTAAPTRRIPYVAALTLAAAAETWSRISGTASALSIDGIRLMNARLAVTAAKAARELGVSFRPFDQTLSDTVAWARTQWEANERSPRRSVRHARDGVAAAVGHTASRGMK